MKQREIKFRAWDGEVYITFDNHKYDLVYNDISGWNIQPNLPNYKGEWVAGESQSKTPNFVLEQFTGLTDKNGTDIYEGDIVKTESKHRNPIAVYWNDELTGFYPLLSKKSYLNTFEVVGNIHQHKHLLK